MQWKRGQLICQNWIDIREGRNKRERSWSWRNKAVRWEYNGAVCWQGESACSSAKWEGRPQVWQKEIRRKTHSCQQCNLVIPLSCVEACLWAGMQGGDGTVFWGKQASTHIKDIFTKWSKQATGSQQALGLWHAGRAGWMDALSFSFIFWSDIYDSCDNFKIEDSRSNLNVLKRVITSNVCCQSWIGTYSSRRHSGQQSTWKSVQCLSSYHNSFLKHPLLVEQRQNHCDWSEQEIFLWGLNL